MNTFLRFPSRLASRLLCCALLASASLGAHASVVWQLNDFVFTDATKASGSFVWDEAANEIISWNIVTEDGVREGVSYSDTTGNAFTIGSGLYFAEGLDQFRLGLASLDALDTPVANLAIFPNNPAQTGPNGFLECTNCGSYRFGNPGAFLSAETPAEVPEPASLALFGLAFGLLGLRRRQA